MKSEICSPRVEPRVVVLDARANFLHVGVRGAMRVAMRVVRFALADPASGVNLRYFRRANIFEYLKAKNIISPLAEYFYGLKKQPSKKLLWSR